MVSLIFQEIYLFRSLFILRQLLFLNLLLQSVLLLFKLFYFLFIVGLLLLELKDRGVQLWGSLLSLELLPHRKSQRTLVQHLVGINRHVELVSNPHK